MKETEQKAINTILNYACKHGIEVNFDVKQCKDATTKTLYEEIYVKCLKTKNNYLLFVLNRDNNDKAVCSLVFNISNEPFEKLNDIRHSLKNSKDCVFDDFVITRLVKATHLYAEYEYGEITNNLISKIIDYRNSPIVRKINELIG